MEKWKTQLGRLPKSQLQKRNQHIKQVKLGISKRKHRGGNNTMKGENSQILNATEYPIGKTLQNGEIPRFQEAKWDPMGKVR